MSLGRLAMWCHHRRWRVLGAWVLAVVAVTALGRSAGGTYVDSFSLPNVESKQAFQVLQARFPARAGDSAQIVFRAPVGVAESKVRARMDRLFNDVGRLPHVVEVSNPYAAGGRAISRDGTIGLATVQFDERSRSLPQAAARRFVATVAAAGGGGLQVEAGGSVAEAARGRALPASEAIGLVAAIVILLVAFGSVIAMGLPVLSAVLGLGVGLGALTLVAAVFDVPKFGPQMAAMIGLGVGIDYALFIVTRYRQELRSGRDPESATRVALSTSGRAVVFAGSVVIVSLLGMFLMGLSFVRGLALGAVIAVLMVMLASITLLPAMLGFAGRAIDKWHLPGLRRDESEHRASVWFRWSRQVQRHPWPYAVVGLAVLVALALPALSIRLDNSDAGNDSTQQTTRRAYDLLSRGFGPGFNGPLVLAAELPRGTTNAGATLARITRAVASTPGVASTQTPQVNPARDAAVVIVYPTTAPQDARTDALVHRLRDEVLPTATRDTGATVFVGGNTATGVDLSSYLASRLPLFIGAVLLFSFVLLTIVFRSLVVALKAAIMNVLSIGAAYGVVVAIFQWGWAKDFVGIDRGGPIEAFIPMMLFAILFGLSMDYEVFLLSRVREEYVRTGDNGLAVADGLAATARVITAAAAVMIAVFLAFVLGDERVIKLFGLGLASAILIDATLVRMLLVPATMELLGDANWWLPGWLDRLLPHLDVDRHDDGHSGEVPPPPEASLPEPEPQPA